MGNLYREKRDSGNAKSNYRKCLEVRKNVLNLDSKKIKIVEEVLNEI